MKKHIVKLTAACVAITLGVVIGTHLSSQADGADAKPGSADDPVVTKSYVDQLFKQMGGELPAGGDNGEAGIAAAMEVVLVPAGKKIVAEEEGTEFIVRSGRAVAYSADKDGISNLTAGKDLTNGTAASKNHLLLSPRPGRGVTPDPKVQNNTLIVLVKGKHAITAY
ncbi:hypothetical protein IDH44_11670 [Paenibacillus sp. IB182496]|uniref:Uncharacterized protein n=1 Tax=Paenibacillus sabuli TaxID=2772509 RepID=A0A927GS23_9BACL|nr:hypothetical protein [Paenibacillus sabuli]MBD2845851.1 hypothetical protein [Paenibacillus sabuli]